MSTHSAAHRADAPPLYFILTARRHPFIRRVHHYGFLSMDDTERRTAKRSRFDQTEPEPKRASRFDRRSRSPPPPRQADLRRSMSPVGRDSGSPATESSKKPVIDAASLAGELAQSHFGNYFTDKIVAAAAAKIHAQIQAKKGIQHVDVPPIRSVPISRISSMVETNADRLKSDFKSSWWTVSVPWSKQDQHQHQQHRHSQW